VILIGYDGSVDARSAIEHAGELLPGEAAIVLTVWAPFVEVMTHTGAGLGLAPGIVDYEKVDAASEKNAQERAAEGAELARGLGLDAKPLVAVERSTVAEAILARAAAEDVRAIVVGSRGLTGLKSFVMGSVSHGVLHHADRPVIVVPSPETIRARA
jgi:nucleotide-binding universal stress UspA family protein